MLLRFLIACSAALSLGAAEVVVAPVASIDAWTGGTLDPKLTHLGAPSLRWEPARSPSLTSQPAISDFSPAGTIQIWIHSSRASGDWLRLAVTTGVDQSETVSGLVQLTWAGWQEVLLPRRAFTGSAGSRPNWRAVQRLEFSFPEGHAAGLLLHLGAVRLGDPPGPRLSDRDLLDLIDLSRGDLSEVRRLTAGGNIEAAIHLLAAYFRHRGNVKWWFDPSHRDPAGVKVDLKKVDEMVAGNATIMYRRFPFRGGVADWSINPTAGRPDQTDEWLWSLNRMDYWNDLGAAWWKTGNPKYAGVFVRQLRSWAQAMPLPNMMDEAPGSGWRGLEAGLRAGDSWPQAWHRFLSAPEFTDADLILMLKCLALHGRCLVEHRVPDPRLPSSNHYLIAWSGLYTVGVLFPELKPAAQWRREGALRLAMALRSGVLADGSWYEFAPGYHMWVLNKAEDALRLARLMGDEKGFPDWYLPMLQSGYEWPVKLMAPDRTFPKVNDTGSDERLRYSPALAALFPSSSLLRWAVSLNHPAREGRAPEPPAWRSSWLESSGYVALRSGWGPADSYACFDVGRLGGWHGHQDKLSLMVWAKGRELLFDGGGGTYDVSAYRKYGQQTESHNTVMVDGRNQNRTYSREADPIGTDDPSTPPPAFVTRRDWDYASGWYADGYGPGRQRIARHCREVAMLRGELFLVSDTLLPGDSLPHQYEARWHLKTTYWMHEKSLAGTLTADPGKANIFVVPLETRGLQVNEDSAVKSPRLLGWDVERGRSPAPALTVRHTRTGSGVQRFLTLLLPLAPGEPNPVGAVRQQGELRWTVVLAGGRTLHVAVAGLAGSGFHVVEVSASGERREYRIGTGEPDAAR
jgi:hypothetical protein